MADDKWPMTDARKPAGKRRIRSFRSVISHFLANSFPDRLSIAPPPGGDVSVYRCDLCDNNLYRDDKGHRHERSACIYDGSLVCRDCEVTGLVYTQEVEDRLARCRTLADFVGAECRKQFDRMIERLGGGFSFGSPSQTRLFNDGDWSFFRRTVVHTPSGDKEGMHGGLIRHGPCPIEDGDTFKFRTWDYGLKCERDAAKAEIEGIHWGIHT